MHGDQPIRLSEPVETLTSVELLDMTGRSVQQGALPAGGELLPVGRNVRPGNYLVLLRDASRQRTLRLVVE